MLKENKFNTKDQIHVYWSNVIITCIYVFMMIVYRLHRKYRGLENFGIT